MIVDSIENGPYVRRMIATPGEPDLPVPERVRQTMKGSDIGEQEKKANLFNEWEKFTSTDGESIESYYHRFMQLMNDLKRNKHFSENIASNLKFLNNLQPEWKSHDRQTQNVGGNGGNQFRQYARQVALNQQGYNAWQNGGIQGAQNAVQNAGVQNGGNHNGMVVVLGIANQSGSGNVVVARAEGTGMGNQARHPHLVLEAPVYDTDGSVEVHLNDNCYNNEIFNMFTQEEQYTDLLEPILEPQLMPQNDNHVTSVAPSMVQSGGIVETSSTPNEEIRAHQETVYRNLVNQVAQKAQQKQQSLYNGNLLLEEHDPPAVYDSDETLELAQESRERMRFLKKEIKPANYAKINHLSGFFVPQTTKSKEELFLSNVSNMVIASKTISIPNEDLSDDTTPSVARKFLNEVKRTSVTSHVDKPKLSVVTPHSKKLHASTQSHSVPQPREFNVMKHRNVIALGMFKINPSQTRVDLVPNKQSSASIRTNPITNSQRHVIVKENVNSDMVTTSSIGLVHTVRTRRPQPKGKTRNARIPSASKSSEVKKVVIVEDHRMTLLLSKNRNTMSSKCNNLKLAIRNDKSKIVCDTYKQCLVTANHDACLTPSVNVLNSRANKLCANVPRSANQNRHRTQVWKPKQVGSNERLAPKPRLPRFSLKWSPFGRNFNLKGKLVASKETNFPNDDKACTSNPQEPMRKRFPNSTVFLGRVYFVEGLGHNLFSVGQFCDANLEVAFRRNTCFIRDLDGVELLKGNRSTNLYTINLHEMASASPICLMACATPTKSWLWHQRLSHLNFDTINDLAKNDLVSSLPKFKYDKEPSCEQGKSKRASHPSKPVPNSKQRLHLLHMDLCGPMRVASINGKRYVLVIVDNYSRYTWVYFLRSKDETPEIIKNILKKIYVRLQAPVIIFYTDNGSEFKNQVLKEYFDSVGITHETSAAKTPQQNGVVERKNRALVEAARTMLIFSHAPLFLWAKAIATASEEHLPPPVLLRLLARS
nr:retrovirus-related Pol polyprotein from transposon TNT 1-94 [Tanacetum cinerariifolium]